MPRNNLSLVALAVALAVVVGTAGPVRARQAKVRTLTEQELVDMMVGSCLQASRSCDSAAPIKRIRDALAQGRKFTMVSLDDVQDDWTIAVPGAVGGGGAWEYVLEDVKKDNLPTVPDVAEKAMEELRRYSGRKIDAIMRVEAASATVSAAMVASSLGVPIVDTCLSGRARPDRQSITNVYGVRSSGPSVAMSRWGDIIIIAKTAAPYRGSHLTRALAVASGGGVTTAGGMLSGADVKRATIRDSVSQAILWGRTVREARARGQDPIAALLKASNGFKLFQGIVSKADGKGDRGFSYWDVELKGVNEYAGHLYKVYVKNENIVTWLDGKPDAISPDFIQNLDPKTGEAITGESLGAYPLGKDVVMVGIPASPLWRVPKGIEIFGPRYFGFDFDYVPIEDQMKTRPKFGGQ